jgi:hypothetical protein
MEKTIAPKAIGLVKKIEKLPWDMSKDRLKLTSNMGPRTKVRMSGAPS